MSSLCEQVGLFLDGELSAGAAASFRQHLGKCHSCPKELERILILDTLAEQALGGPADQPGTMELPAVDEFGPQATAAVPVRRRRKTLLERAWAWRLSRVFWLPVAAGACGALLALLRPGGGAGTWMGFSPATSGPVALEMPRCRTTLGRVADDDYAQPRPCAIARAATSEAETAGGPAPSIRALADLTVRKQYQTVAAVLLNEKDLEGAALFLDKAASSDAVTSDKAVLALEQGDHALALRLSDLVLAHAPGNRAAAWNRAVALERLGRRAEAAQQFARIAATGEAGWADEALRRASALNQPAP